MTATTYEGRQIITSRAVWHSNYPVVDLLELDGVIVVIYDSMAGPRHRQFQNLQAFDEEGHLLWTAEHPTSETADAYIQFTGKSNDLEVWNFAGYRCRIDPRTGRLLESEFCK